MNLDRQYREKMKPGVPARVARAQLGVTRVTLQIVKNDRGAGLGNMTHYTLAFAKAFDTAPRLRVSLEHRARDKMLSLGVE